MAVSPTVLPTAWAAWELRQTSEPNILDTGSLILFGDWHSTGYLQRGTQPAICSVALRPHILSYPHHHHNHHRSPSSPSSSSFTFITIIIIVHLHHHHHRRSPSTSESSRPAAAFAFSVPFQCLVVGLGSAGQPVLLFFGWTATATVQPKSGHNTLDRSDRTLLFDRTPLVTWTSC